MKNAERITKALETLRDAMAPWLYEKLRTLVPEYTNDEELMWKEAFVQFASDFEDEQYRLSQMTSFSSRIDALDVSACCRILISNWKKCFVLCMNKKARNWASLVSQTRNEIAHIGGEDITDEDTTSALDTIAQLAGEMDIDAEESIRAIYREHMYGTAKKPEQSDQLQTKQKTESVIKTPPVAELKPWREVIVPHPDVAQGRYKNAEFAADLAQVTQGEGAYEYRDPVEFFNRTYITEGMKGLLVQALRRVGGKDGEPVIQLKTAFGGGKTHSMLALYHLLRGRSSVNKMSDIKAVLESAEIDRLPVCRVATVVGTSLDPTKSKRPADMHGITVNTVWGEIAYQLARESGDPKLYDFVRDADKKGVSPGSEALKKMFNACGPCVVLMDELVAYARKLWGKDDLVAGTFDNFITFTQEITEAARASAKSIVVASIPESDIEIGGEAGRRALEAIEHTFGRMEAIWKPVGANEGFEIVRRRLFLECKDESARDAVCRAFSRMYQTNSRDFPSETKEIDYYNRMIACYPFHPELFDRLYEDWATIERFQKTRGVLRLMAAVVFKLWMAQDASHMIMPGSVNLDEETIRNELTRYVGDEWNPIVDREVDGVHSIPYQIDQEKYRFGQLMAARRVARTVMIGSAPSAHPGAVQGLETSRIRLGVVQPGESIAIFNDALTALQGALSYLYSNQSLDRYWYDTHPTLKKMVADRASQRTDEDVEVEITHRIRRIRNDRPFARMHPCPETSMDVADDQDLGLVFLQLGDVWKKTTARNAAEAAAEDILNNRGTIPRIYKNMLAFIAADAGSIDTLKASARQYLALVSIRNDRDELGLTTQQAREIDNQIERENESVDAHIRETYCRLLVPYIDRNTNLKQIYWNMDNIRGSNESILRAAAKKAEQNEYLITSWSPALLKMELDNLLWKDKNEIQIGELWKLLCTYCYLPRLASIEVLKDTIRAGVKDSQFFAYADAVQDNARDVEQTAAEKERYIGLVLNQQLIEVDTKSYLVKPESAKAQLDAQAKIRLNHSVDSDGQNEEGIVRTGRTENKGINGKENGEHVVEQGSETDSAHMEQIRNTHFSMTAKLDNTRVFRDVSRIMDEIVNHLLNQQGADIDIKMLVEASLPNGASAQTVRTVTENCSSLHVDGGFEN